MHCKTLPRITSCTGYLVFVLAFGVIRLIFAELTVSWLGNYADCMVDNYSNVICSPLLYLMTKMIVKNLKTLGFVMCNKQERVVSLVVPYLSLFNAVQIYVCFPLCNLFCVVCRIIFQRE